MPKKQTEIPGTEAASAIPELDALISDWYAKMLKRVEVQAPEKEAKAKVLVKLEELRGQLPKKKDGTPYYPYRDGGVGYDIAGESGFTFKKIKVKEDTEAPVGAGEK